ncbi:MAG: hypothetical protein EBQ61_01510 [Micrococcales bacterium]|nr:hypothetical protein [Micrococcales bacterium]
MSDFQSSLRGAVDLSSLANKVVKDKLGNSEPAKSFVVPALSVELSEAIVRSVIQISNVVPVIISFYDSTNSGSISLTSKLEKLVDEGNGNWFLAKVDMVAQPALVEAFGVVSSGTVAMVLAGEPRPLFQGDQSEADLVTFLDRLVALAKDQGLTGKLEVGEPDMAEPEVQLSPAEQAAIEAMNLGNFDEAVAIYEKEIAATPGNEELIERLAQVKLVARTYTADIERELQVIPASNQEVIRKADLYMAIGDAESSFATILNYFEQTDNKQELINHLLELFVIAGKTSPVVVEARKLLAAKMF